MPIHRYSRTSVHALQNSYNRTTQTFLTSETTVCFCVFFFYYADSSSGENIHAGQVQQRGWLSENGNEDYVNLYGSTAFSPEREISTTLEDLINYIKYGAEILQKTFIGMNKLDYESRTRANARTKTLPLPETNVTLDQNGSAESSSSIFCALSKVHAHGLGDIRVQFQLHSTDAEFQSLFEVGFKLTI